MKDKKLSQVMGLVFIAVLLAGLFNPGGVAVHVVVAIIWLLNIITGVLAACSALVLFAEGEARQKLKDTLRKFCLSGDVTAADRVCGWVIKLLIVLTLAFSGWVITLVFYLLAVVVFNLLRGELAEPAPL
jgi:hypothetical protein